MRERDGRAAGRTPRAAPSGRGFWDAPTWSGQRGGTGGAERAGMPRARRDGDAAAPRSLGSSGGIGGTRYPGKMRRWSRGPAAPSAATARLSAPGASQRPAGTSGPDSPNQTHSLFRPEKPAKNPASSFAKDLISFLNTRHESVDSNESGEVNLAIKAAR